MKTEKIIRTTALLLSAAILLSLCACGGKDDPEAPSTAENTEAAETPAPSASGVEEIPPEKEIPVNLLFRCGLVPVCDDGKWGYADKTGACVIPPQFDSADSFSENGLALVSNGGRYGWIDTTGTYVINPQFSSACPFEDGLAAVENDDWLWGLIDETGAYVIEPQFDQINAFDNGGLAVVEKGYMNYGLIDKTGACVASPQFARIGYDSDEPFDHNGIAVVALGTETGTEGDRYDRYIYGYIDRTGTYVINPQFDDADNFAENGLACVGSGDYIHNSIYDERKYGYIDRTGAYVIPPQFDEAHSFSENGLALVCLGKWPECKYGYIDQTGSYVINPRFERAEPFSENGLALVESDGKFGWIDKTGTYVIDPQFGYAESFKDGLAKVYDENGLCGYINEAGTYVIPPTMDGTDSFCYGFENGVSVICRDGKEGLINSKGKYLIEPQYSELDSVESAGLRCFANESGRLGYLDSEGNEVIPAQFDKSWGFEENRFFDDGYAVVQVGSQWGVIDRTGKYVINPQYDEIQLTTEYWW